LAQSNNLGSIVVNEAGRADSQVHPWKQNEEEVMKHNNLKSRQVLFAALLVSLGASQSWTIAENVTYKELASVNQAVMPKFKVSGAATVGQQKKTAEMEISVGLTTREEESFVGLNPDGTSKTEKKRITLLNFTSASCTACLDSKEVVVPKEGLTKEQIQEYAKASLVAHLEREIVREQEAKQYQGNLAARQRQAEACTRKIVDENDRRQDIILRDPENAELLVDCLSDRFEKKYGEKSESIQFQAFKREIKPHLQRLIFSRDDEAVEAAGDILASAQGRFNNERIEDYLYGMERVANDYRGLREQVEELSGGPTNDPQSQAIRLQILRAQMPYTLGTYRRDSQSRDEVAGIDDLRERMLSELRAALQNPNQYVAEHNDSVMDLNRSGGAIRSRINLTGFPQLNFQGGQSHRQGQIAAGPGQFQPMPGQFQPMPGQFQPMPGQFQPMPGQFQPMPGQFQPMPGQFQQGMGPGMMGQRPMMPPMMPNQQPMRGRISNR